MRDLFSEFKSTKPSLIIGKGPSFRLPIGEEFSPYLTIGLNHVCRELKVDIAHIIDFDVINQLGQSLYDNASILVMPYYPHLSFRPSGDLTLEMLCKNHPIISKMSGEGRVFGYNLITASKYGFKVGHSPIVKAIHYSAEAVTNILGHLGVKTIRTLGIDGGTEQSSSFSNLTNFNKERGYDLQWSGIRESIKSFNLDFAPLGVESPIRVFIGAGLEQQVPALVLKHSILKHATMSVDVTIMSEWTHPMPKDRRNWPRTPFSFQRFMIPEKIRGGMGIYMDSDMLVFGDVKEIWMEPTHEGLLVMRNDDIDKHKAKFSVCRYDGVLSHPTIQQIVDDIDSGKFTYEDVVFNFKHEYMGIRDGWNPDWNSLEEYTPGVTKLLHYTEMYNQPWLRNPNHPLGHLWFNELKEWASSEANNLHLLQSHVERGYLLPKCLEVL